MALINFYLCVELKMQTIFFFLAFTVNLTEVSLSFSPFGTSRRCFLIVPKMVVFFNSSANFRLVKYGNYQWSRCNLFQSTVAIDSSKHLPEDLYICFEWGLFLNMVFHCISILSAHQLIPNLLFHVIWFLNGRNNSFL